MGTLRQVNERPGTAPRWVVDIAEQLRAYRKQMRYSQVHMAATCHMAAGTYGHLERPSGAYWPQLETLMQVTRYTQLQFRLTITNGTCLLIPE